MHKFWLKHQHLAITWGFSHSFGNSLIWLDTFCYRWYDIHLKFYSKHWRWKNLQWFPTWRPRYLDSLKDFYSVTFTRNTVHNWFAPYLSPNILKIFWLNLIYLSLKFTGYELVYLPFVNDYLAWIERMNRILNNAL